MNTSASRWLSETRPVEAFVLTTTDGPRPGLRRHDDEVGGAAATYYAGFTTTAFDSIALPSSPDATEWRDHLNSIGPISLTAATIEEFGHSLEEFVGHPVVDETSLTGRYDIELPGEMQGLAELRQALLEQLALELTKALRGDAKAHRVPSFITRLGGDATLATS